MLWITCNQPSDYSFINQSNNLILKTLGQHQQFKGRFLATNITTSDFVPYITMIVGNRHNQIGWQAKSDKVFFSILKVFLDDLVNNFISKKKR